MKKQLVILIVVILLLASCSKADADVDRDIHTLPPVEVFTPTPSPIPTPTPTPPEPTPYNGPRNPLSGLPINEEFLNDRPCAVVINNRKISLPQQGTSKADVIVEVPVEGAYTRMVAVFQDITDAGSIGSVRSARPYLIDIALSFDSIFIHAGGSNAAYSQLRNQKIAHFDETHGPGSSMYFRDAERKRTMGMEHSLLLTSSKVEAQIETQGYRREHEDGYVSPFRFEDDYMISGEKASAVTIKFNSSKTTSFEYNNDTGVYDALQQGSKYIDANNSEQLIFSNLIVIKTAIKVLDKEGRLSVDLTSGGDGYLAIGGQHVPIKWSKAGSSSPFVFKDETGEQITLRSGKTYIAIISNSASAEFSEA